MFQTTNWQRQRPEATGTGGWGGWREAGSGRDGGGRPERTGWVGRRRWAWDPVTGAGRGWGRPSVPFHSWHLCEGRVGLNKWELL